MIESNNNKMNYDRKQNRHFALWVIATYGFIWNNKGFQNYLMLIKKA